MNLTNTYKCKSGVYMEEPTLLCWCDDGDAQSPSPSSVSENDATPSPSPHVVPKCISTGCQCGWASEAVCHSHASSSSTHNANEYSDKVTFLLEIGSRLIKRKGKAIPTSQNLKGGGALLPQMRQRNKRPPMGSRCWSECCCPFQTEPGSASESGSASVRIQD